MLSTIAQHSSGVLYSLFNMALVIAMMCTTLAEFTHTLPFKPTVNSNLKYFPNASKTAHDGDNSLHVECIIIIIQ